MKLKNIKYSSFLTMALAGVLSCTILNCVDAVTESTGEVQKSSVLSNTKPKDDLVLFEDKGKHRLDDLMMGEYAQLDKKTSIIEGNGALFLKLCLEIMNDSNARRRAEKKPEEGKDAQFKITFSLTEVERANFKKEGYDVLPQDTLGNTLVVFKKGDLHLIKIITTYASQIKGWSVLDLNKKYPDALLLAVGFKISEDQDRYLKVSDHLRQNLKKGVLQIDDFSEADKGVKSILEREIWPADYAFRLRGTPEIYKILKELGIEFKAVSGDSKIIETGHLSKEEASKIINRLKEDKRESSFVEFNMYPKEKK